MNHEENLLIQLRKKLTSHKWAIILAFIAALIIAYPQLWFRYNGDVDGGIEAIGASDDELQFLARVREVQDGHVSLSDPYLKEGKDKPYLFFSLGSAMVAGLGKIFSLDLNNTILLSRFLFAFLVFLIIYSFVLLFSKDKLTALCCSSTILLSSILLSRPWRILKMLGGESPKTNFLMFTRPVSPALTAFFFFGFLLAFWLFLEKKQWRWGILSAVILGLTFYDYFYTMSFLYVFCGFLALIFLFRKRWPDAKKIIIILLGGILIAIPYFFNLYQANQHTDPTFTEISQRHGLIETRAFTLGFLVPFLFIAFLLFFPRKYEGRKERYFFSLALLTTPFIVLNQQIITGRTLVNAHYHWYFHTPLAIIFLLVIFFHWVSRFPKIKRAVAILIIMASIYTGVFIQNASYAANKDETLRLQRYGSVIEWLNSNAEKDEVVFASGELSQLIAIYTPLNVFHNITVSISLAASRDRLVDTLFLLYRLDGVEKDTAEAFFLQDKENISWSLYGLHYRETTGEYENIPDEIVLELAQKYKASLAMPHDEFLNGLWSKYDVKYLVWDKESQPQWQLTQYPFLEKMAEIGDFTILCPIKKY